MWIDVISPALAQTCRSVSWSLARVERRRAEERHCPSARAVPGLRRALYMRHCTRKPMSSNLNRKVDKLRELTWR